MFNFLGSLVRAINNHIIVTDKSGNILYSTIDGKKIEKINDKALIIEDEHYLIKNGEFAYENEIYDVTSLVNVTFIEKELYGDTKTSALSSSGFDSHLRLKIPKCKENDEELVIVMFDIDNFKTINDTYGHQIGDEILSKMTDLFTNSIRKTDLIGRFGGDEFTIAMFGISLEKAKEKIESIVKILKNGIKCSNDITIEVTLSIGMSLYDYNKTFSNNIDVIDNALYESKENGKNKITLARKPSIK